MFITDANTPQDDEEPWMALPLFNRKGSPDHTQGVLTWFSSWPPPPESDDIVPLSGYDHLDHHDHHDHHNHHNHFDDSPPATSSTRSSRPQSVSLASESCYYDSSHSNGTSLSNGTNNGTGSQPVIDSYFPGDDEDGNDSGSGFGRQQPGLLDEISDEHIPQPSFTPCSACPYPDCKSDAVFTTGRDFRRHYRQHFKRFFCRYAGCPQSARDAAEAGVGNKGFATRKDRTRHEAKHNPAIQCKWRSPSGEQCSRTFSRMDNMRDHYRRIHNK
ncbi:hypothetical protein N3K66_000019 [Trichothecium roseum]|uniref:Uncharacterized protein n=1 Tax=Trichothecium roseum TaxID=47278 RepID=A0ACC0VAP1_9HYPO|nr:hypothetical protein N3K66_000019 [Trichothecium roseum]